MTEPAVSKPCRMPTMTRPSCVRSRTDSVTGRTRPGQLEATDVRGNGGQRTLHVSRQRSRRHGGRCEPPVLADDVRRRRGVALRCCVLLEGGEGCVRDLRKTLQRRGRRSWRGVRRKKEALGRVTCGRRAREADAAAELGERRGRWRCVAVVAARCCRLPVALGRGTRRAPRCTVPRQLAAREGARHTRRRRAPLLLASIRIPTTT
jgi:hypothetical protein